MRVSSSCTSPPTSVSPENLSTAGLSSRGGTVQRGFPAAVRRHLPQPVLKLSLRPGFPREEAPSNEGFQQLYFATYLSQP